MASQDFNSIGTKFKDGANGGILTLGRHNKWGHLGLMGPDGKLHNLGLMETFEVTEENGTSYDTFAGGNWLELNIGTPMWRGQGARSHVRGADIKSILFGMYSSYFKANFPTATGGALPGGQSTAKTYTELNLSVMPFVWYYNFNYSPPTIDTNQTFEAAQWIFHKVVIVSHTNSFITGANQRIRESFTFIGAGEQFSSGNSLLYQSDTSAWQVDFPSATATAGLSVGTPSPVH